MPHAHFPIRGDTMRSVLETNNVVFTASGDSAKLENTEIASRGAASTVRARCLRTPATAATPTVVLAARGLRQYNFCLTRC